ncbi:MAG: catalase [Actinomycetota bacterium]
MPTTVVLTGAVLSGFVIARALIRLKGYVRIAAAVTAPLVVVYVVESIRPGSWPWRLAFAFGTTATVVVAVLRTRHPQVADPAAEDRSPIGFTADGADDLVDRIDRRNRSPLGEADASTRPGGARAGFRAAHPHGDLVTARFRPSHRPTRLTTAAVLDRDRTPGWCDAIVRFSNSAGLVVPGEPSAGRRDREPGARGLAVSIDDPRGRFDLVCIDIDRFIARDLNGFRAVVRVGTWMQHRWFPVRWWGLLGLLALAITGRTNLRAASPSGRPPSSFLDRTYHALHSYRFVDADDRELPVRLSWVPDRPPRTFGYHVRLFLDGIRRLLVGVVKLLVRTAIGPRTARWPWIGLSAPSRALRDDLRAELEPATNRRFRLVAQLGDDVPANRVDDLLHRFPRSARTVELGVLELIGMRDRPGPDLVRFEPSRLPEGIDPPRDELFTARLATYPTSFQRRRATNRTRCPVA